MDRGRTDGGRGRLRRGLVVAVLGGVLALSSAVPPASAANPALSIHGKFTFDFATSTAQGTFVATGTSVLADGFCHSGAAWQTFAVQDVDADGPTHVTGTDTYTCGDGSGSIDIDFDAQRVRANQWNHQFDLVGCIVGGTGAYTGLQGVAEGTAHANLKNNKVALFYDFAELGPQDCPLDG